MKKVVSGIGRELADSELQVAYLRRLMESKVNTLMTELASQKLLTATTISTASENTEVTNTVLHDLFVEKSLVVQLRSELHDTQVNHLPLPETLDGIKANLECLLDCTSSKGTHLQTKVRTICESVLSGDVYNGQCLPYLVARTQGLVQRKNPYQRAMQIARIIDLRLRCSPQGYGDGR
jgi:hypothetical protein